MPRVDVLAALEAEPDYVVPFWRQRPVLPRLETLVTSWCSELDLEGQREGRADELLAALEPYELVTLPLPDSQGRPNTRRKLAVLRRRDLGFTPRLQVEGDASHLTVRVQHDGHEQLADLVVYGLAPDGRTVCLEPDGGLSTNVAVRARASLLLSQTGERSVTLFDGPLDSRVAELEQLRAVLVNPGASFDLVEGRASDEVVLTLD